EIKIKTREKLYTVRDFAACERSAGANQLIDLDLTFRNAQEENRITTSGGTNILVTDAGRRRWHAYEVTT
ncbi:unnamed protein product, partial [Amoebophrya sp. A25]